MAKVTIKATPKFTKELFSNEPRYLKKWNGTVKVKRVDIIPTGEAEGSIVVTMTSKPLQEMGMVISDIFAPRKENSTQTSEEWAGIQLSKTAEALNSAGLEPEMDADFEEGKEKEFLRDTIKPLLDKLEGKEVCISQYYKNDTDRFPRLKYKVKADEE